MTELESDPQSGARNTTQITVTLPDPAEGQELLGSLLSHVNAIEGGKLHLSTAGSGEILTITVDGITRKQCQAVRTAVELGYYGDPRTATLDDVAAELGISNSGASGRLRTVERKLVVALAEQLGE